VVAAAFTHQALSSSYCSQQVLPFLEFKGMAPAHAPHFALAQAFANPDILSHFSDQPAAKLFKAGTEALSSIKFDCKPDS
jgi:hypothetical protein